MKINNSKNYALMAVGYIASHLKDGNILAQTISQKYNIPLDYLLNILQQLCQAGILQSKRGPGGGFLIGRDPSKITLLQIIEVIEGSTFDRLNFIKNDSNDPFLVKMKQVCEKANAEVTRILSEATVADMIGTKKK